MCPRALLIEDFDRVSKALTNPLALLPWEAENFKFTFTEIAIKNIVSPEALKSVQNRCFLFMLRLCEELLKQI